MRLDQYPDSEDGNHVDVAENGVEDVSLHAPQRASLSVEVEGTSTAVHVEVGGPSDAARILVLHGWGASIEHMRGLIDDLSRDHLVAAVDFPGHGQSPTLAVGYGMEGHLDVIEAVLDHLGWTSFAVIGHSNGGRAAISWAASSRGGDRSVSAMALVAPSGIRRRRTARYYAKAWTARLLKAPFQIFPGPLKRAGLDWLRHSLVWRLLGSSDYRSLEGSMRETFVRTVNHYVEDVLTEVSCPVVLIRGENDDAISDEQLQVMQRGLPDAGMFIIPDAGHFAQMERPDIVAQAVRELMRS